MFYPRKFYTLFFFLILSVQWCAAQETIIRYLSGTDKANTVTWDFYCTKGRNSGKWTTIPVPSCWELQGFGTYNYGQEKPSLQSDESGLYRYRFKADKQWRHMQVNIVFEGSMTDTRVRVNGKLAGKVHQGSFYRFKYDITPLLKFGQVNLLEVRVDKKSANNSVNQAERQGDFWIFGGIFRPVYLEVLPEEHIKRMAIHATASGDFMLQAFTANGHKGHILEAEIKTVGGIQSFKPVSVQLNVHDTVTTLRQHYENIKLWSPEFPNLYRVKVSLKDTRGNVIHTVNQKFGFRTAVLRPHDGFYLNGKKVLFKGVNHHSFWPESGRTTSKSLSIRDVSLMKAMNMNAVRTSHYPPDTYFLDVCDSMGLMVLDELTGWQQFYDDTTGHRLVKAMVTRDVNHPSVVIWDNGNEGGFNRNLDKDFEQYDPQKRLVIHPWGRFNGTHTKHYPTYHYLEQTTLADQDVFFPTEFLHGLYDGGSGSGLDDYWRLMERAPRSAGGFLWDFADGGIVRTDKQDSIDTHGNKAPDGIVGPYREKEGSFYAIKEIWSPVYIDKPFIRPDFGGKLLVENRYLFTNLDQCTFQWKLVSFSHPSGGEIKATIDATGRPDRVSVGPGEKQWMDLALPASWTQSDALYLTASDPYHKEIFTWSWPIHTPAGITGNWMKKKAVLPVRATDQGNVLIVDHNKTRLYFNKKSGFLEKVVTGRATLPLSGGPVLAGFQQTLVAFDYSAEDDRYVIKAAYKGKDNWLKITWTFIPGMPVQLAYTFSQKGKADFIGITFNYPENEINGMTWLGRGPYPVWKNRLKGLEFGVWDKTYNNTVAGKRWQYPPFKGNHAEAYWIKIKTKEKPFTIFMGDKPLFFQMLKIPGYGGGHTSVKFPEGNIGFMSAIQPIGTKFHRADELGPQSQSNLPVYTPYTGILWFDFE